VLVSLGSGAVRVAADTATSLAVDVDAELTPTLSAAVHALTPRSLTRQPLRIGTGSARVPVLGHAGVPDRGVRSVLLQMHVARATTATALTVWPAGRPRPDLPDLLVARHGSTDSFVVVPVGPRGVVRVGNRSGSVSASMSVVGWVG
jgi:hypothetical protein